MVKKLRLFIYTQILKTIPPVMMHQSVIQILEHPIAVAN